MTQIARLLKMCKNLFFFLKQLMGYSNENEISKKIVKGYKIAVECVSKDVIYLKLLLF